MIQTFDIDKMENQIERLRQEFHSAQPFEYVIIDNFLNNEIYHKILSQIPEPQFENKSRDFIFARNKFESPNFQIFGEVFAALKDDLRTERFAAALSSIYGRKLFVDPNFVGGGLHQGGERSYLDMHADFNRHPGNADWLRELNLLLYLNPDYKDEYGGHLELQNATSGVQGRISPIGNRLVIMLTKEHTLHGYKEVSFPSGQYRTSIAAYAYSVDQNYDIEPARSTKWNPNSANPLRSAIARVSPALVAVKNRLFGSRTVKRAMDLREQDTD
jgi:hypothetical protein